MDEKDQEILRLLHKGLPLDPEPFKAIGDKLWIDEMSVISRLASMHQSGQIRHLGVFFDSRKLGYSGVLAAMQVPPEALSRVSEALQKIPGVTHNYLRDGEPNLWFTLIAHGEEEERRLFDQIRRESGISDIKLFPSRRLFKVRTDID